MTPQERLTELEAFGANWDGWRAAAISPLAIAAARALLVRVGDGVPDPWVYPEWGGGVEVEWDHDGETLSFIFAPSGKAVGEFIDCWNEEVTWEEP